MKDKIDTMPDWGAAEVRLVRETLFPGFTDAEYEMLGAYCARTKLSPFVRQIYMTPKNTREGDEWVKKASIQVSIDGLRSLAEETGQYCGNSVEWCNEDGKWHDVWIPSKEGAWPYAAKASVWRAGSSAPFTAIARWDSYQQVDRKGTLTPFWRKMPDGQLAKCAEALALRKAFPGKLSGLYAVEEMQLADNPHPEESKPLPPATRPNKAAKPDSPGKPAKPTTPDASASIAVVERLAAGVGASTADLDAAFARALELETPIPWRSHAARVLARAADPEGWNNLLQIINEIADERAAERAASDKPDPEENLF